MDYYVLRNLFYVMSRYDIYMYCTFVIDNFYCTIQFYIQNNDTTDISYSEMIIDISKDLMIRKMNYDKRVK